MVSKLQRLQGLETHEKYMLAVVHIDGEVTDSEKGLVAAVGALKR